VRLYGILFTAFFVYLLYAVRPPLEPWAFARLIAYSLAAGFGLVVSLLPLAGPYLYSALLSYISSTFAVEPPALFFTAAWWISWALTLLSTIFIIMYLLEIKRYIAKLAFKILLY
jgi:hypothetical protein